uniref:Uncharacterized protein n=1 Tax=Bracon brevicornis TaxID=1563983 RepID=A0A6V7JGR1_9HYME
MTNNVETQWEKLTSSDGWIYSAIQLETRNFLGTSNIHFHCTEWDRTPTNQPPLDRRVNCDYPRRYGTSRDKTPLNPRRT